jgi:hypothetical protein
MKVYIAEILVIPDAKGCKDRLKDDLELTLLESGFSIGNVTLKDAEVVLCDDE